MTWAYKKKVFLSVSNLPNTGDQSPVRGALMQKKKSIQSVQFSFEHFLLKIL